VRVGALPGEAGLSRAIKENFVIKQGCIMTSAGDAWPPAGGTRLLLIQANIAFDRRLLDAMLVNDVCLYESAAYLAKCDPYLFLDLSLSDSQGHQVELCHQARLHQDRRMTST